MEDLTGHVALVTGGSRGIGASIALDLAEHGADVALTYRSREAEAEGVVAKIRGLGRRGLAVRADQRDPEAAREAVRAVLGACGRLDILVNNAGVTADAIVWKMTDEQWQSVVETNLTGYFYFAREVAPLFRHQNSGRIINITSINGMRGKVGQSNYSAAKAGVIGFTKALARELGRFGVTVNAVAPGFIMAGVYMETSEEVREAALRETVLGRAGAPEDVAAAVTFLASDRARHITGVILRVDGGQYI